ncbi:uncharacterized protein LOC113304126 [Papaver somniferum]|uniref:uncharacterized protein LOC113304126 n=1 Tax=Papaver somniferum TaxID=3469 RepID=UPI000E6FC104|nr:uncharacterized protein LOC113304126 [Papaver somniferum]
MHDHRAENLFQEILNFVSIRALNIVYDEIPKNGDMESMDVNMICNCLARTVNGLPCACELSALKKEGKVIPLNIIDPFWRQLSSSPPSSIQITLPFEETPEFFAIRNRWERVTENKQVRILAQLQPIAFPGIITLLDPDVSEIYMGRKSKKQLIKDRSTVREPSFYEHIDKTVNILAKLGEKRNREMLAAQKKDIILVNPRYLTHLPLIMRKFIAATQEMSKDGNSGYHVLLKQLAIKVKHHNPCRYLREVMIGNIECHRTMYEEMWGVDLLKQLKDGIHGNEWMKMPESGFIIAEAFTTTVVYLSEEQSITFVPITKDANPKIRKNMVVIGFVNSNHYIGLKLKRSSPLPSLPRFSYWEKQKNKNNFSNN